MVTQRIIELLRNGQPDESVTIKGWVRTKRELKGFSFIEVNDGSSLANLQVVLNADLPDYETVLKPLNTGASVEVSGVIVASQGKGQRIELKASTVQVYGSADPETYPLQKKRHSFEFLRTIGHLRSRTNTLGAVFRVRNACSQAIHQFFQEQGFLWVHTPMITANDCEGAGELFTVTNLDLKDVPKTDKSEVDFSQDFFGRRAFLTVSGQLQAEVMALSFRDVYTFGPTLKYIFKFVLEQCPEDMEFFNQRIDNSVLATADNIINNQFERITYTDAIALLEKADRKFEYPVSWGLDLQSEHERYLAEELFKKPVIVNNYPVGIKAFYMRLNDDEKTVAAMDVLAPKIGEIIGGSQREERLDVLERRIIAQGMNPEDLWWYLDLRRYGTVPHAGFGLGFERVVQFMTGMGNIRDVIPFPRTPLSAEF
jgi:asparaginyl-tRNA synthetase